MTRSLRFAGKKDLVKQRIEILDLSLPEPIPASAEMDRGKLPLAQAILRSERQ